MTTQPPQADEQLPPANGDPEDAAVAGSDAESGEVARGTSTTKTQPRRATDYRLRGLDLDAHAAAGGPPRPIKKGRRSRRRRRRLFIQWVVVLALIAAVAMLLRATVVRPYAVSSTSMVPTLQVGTDVLVVKQDFVPGSIETGDIIVFRQPRGFSCRSGGGESQDIVSRVIGLPGETIQSKQGSIYIDGRRLKEPGWYNPPFGELDQTKIARTKIPAGSYFVMGDNRTDTCDSRSFGAIPKSLLVGSVVATILRDGHPYVHFM